MSIHPSIHVWRPDTGQISDTQDIRDASWREAAICWKLCCRPSHKQLAANQLPTWLLKQEPNIKGGWDKEVANPIQGYH